MKHKIPWFLAVGAMLLLVGCRSTVVPGPHPPQKAITALPTLKSDRTLWPTAGWKVATPEAVGVDSSKLQEALKYAMSRSGDDKNRKGIRTDGMLVIRKGQLILEGYARGFKKNTRHLAWSMSKSFTNALVGIASKQGLLKIDAPAHLYYPALNRPHHKKITVKHLLQMTDGLGWNEGYEASPLDSSVIMMLYTAGRSDMAKFTASTPMRYHPGTHWHYSSGTTNLLMGVLRNALKKRSLEDFAWKELFDKIGMKDVTWERDGTGLFVGSSYLWATPRQLAKFGYLFLNDGVWNGTRLLPKGWVKFSTTTPTAEQKGRYGAQWWLNVGRPEKGIPRRYKDAPRDAFFASGHWGQSLFVIPSLDLVIVRVADDRDDTFDRNHLLKLIIDSIKDGNKTTRPLPTPSAGKLLQVKDEVKSPAPKPGAANTPPATRTNPPTRGGQR